MDKQLKNKAFIISIDIPSGLNASNGETFNNVVNADQTIMCLTQKQGCFTGKDQCIVVIFFSRSWL